MLEKFVTIICGSTETVIDGFDTVFGPNVGKCGIAWKIIKCVILFALTLWDLILGILGLQEFESLISSYHAVDSGLFPFLIMWVMGYVTEALLCISLLFQFSFSIYVICKMHTRVGPGSPTHQKLKVQKLKRCHSIWSKINNILMFVFSDVMVGLGRVLVAFQLPAQVSFLQTPIERLSSSVAFTATCIQILLATDQLAWNLVMSKKRPGQCCFKEYLWDIFALLLMCLALAPPAWLIVPPFGLFIFLFILVSMIVCLYKR